MLNLLFVYSGDYGERVIRNLINDPSFCKACGLLCDFCKYGVYSHVHNIHAAIELPDPVKLPRFIEKPEKYLPKKDSNPRHMHCNRYSQGSIVDASLTT